MKRMQRKLIGWSSALQAPHLYYLKARKTYLRGQCLIGWFGRSDSVYLVSGHIDDSWVVGLTSLVPNGHIGFATFGDCCNPVTNALLAAIVAAETPAASIAASGRLTKAKLAASATRRSCSRRLVAWLGSMATTISGMIKLTLIVAYWIAAYQSLKKALTAIIVRCLVLIALVFSMNPYRRYS